MNTAGPGIGPFGQASFDASRGRVVLHGGLNGAGTWEWTGTAWVGIATNPQPGRVFHGLAYDSQNQRLIAHGGRNRLANAETVALVGNTWTELLPRPRAKTAATMAFHSQDGRAILFGGFDMDTSAQPSAETWLWDGDSWTRGPTGPSGRARAAMTYDSIRQRVILHGGSLNQSDVWEWDGSAWNQGPSGPERGWHSLAFDPVRGETVLFGGGGFESDTWVYNGTTWRRASTIPPGAGRRQPALAYSPARQRVILFGGQRNPGGVQSDTWEWDGSSWTQIPVSGPPAREGHFMSTDSASGRIILGGGRNSGGTRFEDLWAFDGTAWLQIGGTPGEMLESAVAYDSTRGELVAFGGRAIPVKSTLFRLPLPVAPSFTTHPLAAWAFVGESISLSAQAAGVPVPTFQWRKNSVDIPGETGSTLTINTATPDDAGVYDCVATSTCGSTTSLAARVAVTGSVPT